MPISSNNNALALADQAFFMLGVGLLFFAGLCWCVYRLSLSLSASSAQQRAIANIPLKQRINSILPQTQCGQCGYEGCQPYAQAMAQGAAINQCPPGGDKTIKALAELLARPVISLNPLHGVIVESVQASATGLVPTRQLAVIREEECIGCTKCIKACPVDAILGAAKFMHSVIESECTGCDLCVEPCPVDCIEMISQADYMQPQHLTQPIAQQMSFATTNIAQTKSFPA